MIDRTHRELTDDDIDRIASTYHAWRGDLGAPRASGASGAEARIEAGLVPGAPRYEDVPGFCMAATLDDIRQHSHILTPGRYVGAAEVEDDDEPFEEKMERLTAELRDQIQEAIQLDGLIWANLEEIGYGG